MTMTLVDTAAMVQLVAFCFVGATMLTTFGVSFWRFGSTFSMESVVCGLFPDIFLCGVFLTGAGVFNKISLASDLK